MFDDPSTIEVHKSINSDAHAREIWREVNKPSVPHFHKLDNRKVTVRYKGNTFEMDYSVNSVFDNYRFDVVEYKPTNPVLKVVSKLF